MLRFPCLACGQRYTVPDHAAGKIRSCVKCGEPMRVPGIEPEPEEIALPEPQQGPVAVAVSMPTTKPAKVKRTNMGGVSLWCGLLSLLVCLPLGVIAVILGFLSLALEPDGKKGDAVAGIVFGMIGAGLGWFLFFSVVLRH